MEGLLGPGSIIVVIIAILYLVAPLKLFSIHSELQRIRKLLEAQDERAKTDQSARLLNDIAVSVRPHSQV